MGNLPVLEKLADMQKIRETLSKAKPHAILRSWAETAGEIVPAKRAEIEIVRKAYAEIDEGYLDADRLLLFAETILGKLGSEEDQRLLVTTQLIGARKIET